MKRMFLRRKILQRNESLSSDIQDTIRFDDLPIELLLKPGQPESATSSPADIIDAWRAGMELNHCAENALVSVVAGNRRLLMSAGNPEGIARIIEKVLFTRCESNEHKCLLMLALWRISRNTRPSKAANYYSLATEMIKTICANADSETSWLWKKHLHDMESDTPDDIPDESGSAGWFYPLNGDGQWGQEELGPWSIRSRAYDLLVKNELLKALELYDMLLGMGFELPGTLCHMARVYLLLAEDDEAIRCVSMAWQHREQAPAYVLQRIIFFKILLCKLMKKRCFYWMKLLEKELHDHPLSQPWTIQQTVDSCRSRLSPKSYHYLAGVAAMLERGGRGEMECNIV